MPLRFTIRDLLLIILIAALAAGWWIDHQRINRLTVQQWEYLDADINKKPSASKSVNSPDLDQRDGRLSQCRNTVAS
jgi:hypothetical protein